MKKNWLFVLMLLLALSFALVGCGDDADEGSTTTLPGTETTTTTLPDDDSAGEEPSEEVTEPGYYEQQDGTVQVVGILTYRDLEGGFWAVVETTDAGEAADADILAVLGPSDQIPGPIGSYENKYVSVVGMPQSVSVYQAGQFVEMQSIKTLAGGTGK